MSKEAKSADLILKLYDLRREDTMRKARNWMFSFNPTSAEDVNKTMMDPEVGGYLRMVMSYWDMAAALVKHGAIDEDMFCDTNGEYIGVYAKLQPFLKDLREQWQMPEAFAHLENLVMERKGGPERVERTQQWMKEVQEKMQAASSEAASA